MEEQKTLHWQQIPLATYRLQLNFQFPFSDAAKATSYLSELGITDCYASPITRAKEGSLHGYDVVAFDQVNPELGGIQGLESWSKILQKEKMGLLVDFVPNHMYASLSQNPWWIDVLTYGQESKYAPFFDIDWKSSYPPLAGKIMIPFLAKVQYQALQDGDIDLVYNKGMFYIIYYDRWLPVQPKTWEMLLKPIFETLKDKRPQKFPTSREELDQLYRESRDFRHVLDQYLEQWNGTPGDFSSFRFLKQLLDKQAYRLSFWRMAYEHINYRRFFDINELIGLRQENPETFAEVHKQLFQWIDKGWITGLRIDHIDGIANPKKYLDQLHTACQDKKTIFLLVEKILADEETLPNDWPVAGTTGYDFLNLVSGLFVLQENRDVLEEIYQSFTGIKQGTQETLYRAKEVVLHTLFRGEIIALARAFSKTADEVGETQVEQDVAEDLFREMLACLPVYRTYIRPEELFISPRDKVILHETIEQAKAIRPDIPPNIFALLFDLFCFQTVGKTGFASETHRDCIRRFQQISGSVMAKGVEDTGFYRRYPLSSLNEVGAEMHHFAVSKWTFHQGSAQRQKQWPHTLLTTYTHDTKRSEDTRMRIHVLSEIPQQWKEALYRWHTANNEKRAQLQTPDLNEEYLIYQSLIGTWPLEPMGNREREDYLFRIDRYMTKATKEAKIHTSWVDPDDRHEKDLNHFIREILTPTASTEEFLQDFQRFIKPVQIAGLWNSLSQLILKTTSPGIPDFYQGSELWDFRLVDPDNRNRIDFSLRKQILAKLKKNFFKNPQKTLFSAVESIETGEIKLLCTYLLLNQRRELRDLFQKGSYIPLNVKGEGQDHWICFGRKWGEKTLLVIVSRLFIELFNPSFTEINPKEATLYLPKEFAQGQACEIFTKKLRMFNHSEIPIIDLVQPWFPFGVWVIPK